MGLRRLCLLLSVTSVLAFAGCGDNEHFKFHDAGTDTNGSADDAAIDAPPDALICTSPQIKCGTTCINPTTDNNNCGGCAGSGGMVCTGGAQCQTDGSSSICCPAGQHNCGGQCVNFSDDESHCGSCTTTCGNNETCDNGTCCGPSTTVCQTGNGPQCFNLNTDEQHCGACTTACNNGETCTTESNNTNPKCCTTGDNNCGGTCSDPKTDEAHCGNCATACNVGNGESCSDGKCCGTGTVSCDGLSCVSPGGNTTCNATDGNCGTDCTQTSRQCKTNTGNTSHICCSASENNCGGTCSNPLTDNANCGACGNACGSGTTCSNGVCCGPGETGCGTGVSAVCVDLNTDDQHCGGCNTQCQGATPVCDGAQCAAACDTAAGETNCSGDCVFTNTDHDHCGSCTNQCLPNQVCSNGSCAASCASGTLCGGSCVNTQTDQNHCGSCTNICNPGDACVGGVCQLNCPPGQVLCGGVCVNPLNDDAHCSTNNTCGSPCASGSSCQLGVCCPTGQVNCNGSCVNPSSNTACGATGTGVNACGTNCTTQVPSGQTCQTTGNSHICCASGQVNCTGPNGNVCADVNSDEANCGACASAGGTVCGSGATCDQGLCCASPLINLGNNDQVCCPNPATVPGSAVCGVVPQCVNTLTDNANCGGCGNACGMNQFCSAGQCTSQCTGVGPTGNPKNTHCDVGAPVCTDPTTDPNHCGDPASGGTCAFCTSGSCNNGTCRTCAQVNGAFPDQCPPAGGPGSICTNLTNDVNNCGACDVFCNGGEQCTHDPAVTVQGQPGYGKCCSSGQNNCAGTCVDFQTGIPQANGTTIDCGSCGNTCAAGSTCTNGACTCGFGQTKCGNQCVTEVNDNNHCGSCTNVCDTANGFVCVSGSCTTTCPAPLVKCGNKCVNKDDDDANCGACGNPCNGTTGCSAGACVPDLFPNQTTPPKCVGGGPPIIVPTGGGDVCTGNLGQVAFTFGMCSRTNIGSLSQQLYTDAFDSTAGTYVNSCTNTSFPPGNQDDDSKCASPHCVKSLAPCPTAGSTVGCTSITGDQCQYPVKCVGGTCVGGGVGVNGTVTPVASNSANTHVGGAFWVYGTTGLAMKGNTQIKQDFINQGSLDISKTSTVWGKTYKGPGSWTDGGNTSMTLKGMLFSEIGCGNNAIPNSVNTQGGCTSATQNHWWGTPGYGSVDANNNPIEPPPPCGENDGSDGSLIDIKTIVNYYKIQAHNDNFNVTPPILYNTLDAPLNTIRLDLSCGYYYFNQMNIGKDTTIVVHGRAAIIVGGAMRVSQKLILDLDANATLDIFVGGVVNVSNIVELGSPAYPRRSRIWIGRASCLGSGACTNDTQCCSGVCNAGFCGTGGGGNLSQSMSLSNGGFFNGLIWSGYGAFTHSNPLEMYGSIYAGHFDASGDTLVHYDIGATKIGEECPPPSGGPQICESCRDCGNQPCINNRCAVNGVPACTTNGQCCAPLHCDLPTGVCKL